ncbi:hypothetical protein NCCP2648_02970 [Lacticaseibacillus rhamnosus]|nr:hypothetical protein NCCP2648_02970 [Lacticaseibacillus rhamnosus]
MAVLFWRKVLRMASCRQKDLWYKWVTSEEHQGLCMKRDLPVQRATCHNALTGTGFYSRQ